MSELSDKTWNPMRGCDTARLADPLRWRKPRRVSVDSMFHESLTNEQIAAVFGVMAACPQHTFQVLTKRARRMREWFAWASTAASLSGLFGYAEHTIDDHDGRLIGMLQIGKAWPLPNVWLGVSVENQAAADERIPDLLATPAEVRFLSCEPLLGNIRIDGQEGGDDFLGDRRDGDHGEGGIDWVIAGCESGAGARPCEVDWLRSLRDQCAAAGTAFFLNQAVESPLGSCPHCFATPHYTVLEDHRWTWGCSCVTDREEDDQPLAIACGPGSRRKLGGIIELPYLDGVHHAALPKVQP